MEGRLTKAAFSESCPDIFGAAYRFFRSIVHIVADRLSGLRLKLHRQDQRAVRDDDEVPLFRGSEVPR